MKLIHSRPLLKLFQVIGIFACLLPIDLSAQVSIDLNEPRALAKAILLLKQTGDVAIHYEDHPYVNLDDLYDWTSESTSAEQRQMNPNIRLIGPKRQILRVLTPVIDANNSIASHDAALETLRVAFNQRLEGTLYQLTREGTSFLLRPSYYRDQSGRRVSYTSILEQKINLSGKPATPAEYLDLITQEAGKQVNLPFKALSFPIRDFGSSRVTLAAGSTAARDAIFMLLSLLEREVQAAGSKRRYSYHLYFDPGVRWWGLNIFLSEAVRPSDSINSEQPAITGPKSRFAAVKP